MTYNRLFVWACQVASDAVTSTRNIEVPVVAVAESQTVTVAGPQEEKGKKKSKDGGGPPGTPATPGATVMSTAGATVSFVLNNITNPGWSGVTGEMLIRVVNPSVTEDQDAAAVERLKQIQDAIAAGRPTGKLSELPRRFLATYQLPGNEIQPGAFKALRLAYLVHITRTRPKHQGVSVSTPFLCVQSIKASLSVSISLVCGYK